MKTILIFEKNRNGTYGKMLGNYRALEIDNSVASFPYLLCEPYASHFELPEGLDSDCVEVQLIDGVPTLVQKEELVLEKRQQKANSVLDAIRLLREPLLKDADVSIFKLEDDTLDATSMRAYRKALRECTENLKELSGEAKIICENIVPSEFQFPTKPLV